MNICPKAQRRHKLATIAITSFLALLAGCATSDAKLRQALDSLPDFTVTDPKTGCTYIPREDGGPEQCLIYDFPSQNPEGSAKVRFASVDAAKWGTIGRWVELESDRPTRRYYVAMTRKRSPGGLTRMHLRYDVPPDAPEPAMAERMVSLVTTLDLDCTRGETTELALHSFDKHGKTLFSQSVDKPRAERILHFYQSPLRHVCSGDYLLPSVVGGDALAGDLHQRIAQEQRRRVPDLHIAVPPAEAH